MFSSIVNVVSKKFMQYCQEKKLAKCYHLLLKQLSFNKDHSKIESYQNQVQYKLERENMPTSFTQYTAFHVL